MQEEIKNYLAKKAELAVELEKLEKAFWPILNDLIDNGDVKAALELARSLPECSLRMRAIPFVNAEIERIGGI